MIFMLLLSVFLSISASAIDFNKYHSIDEINQYLRSTAKENPSLASYKILGLSEQKREISYLILSSGTPSNKPAVFFNGTHHGNEKSSTEVVLGLIDYFIKNKNQPKVRTFLDTYSLYFQPLVNPDGHALNIRGNHQGIDPNRDYSSPEKEEKDSFRLPEIKLVKRLVDQIKFRGALAYHSGIEIVLWPWCYTSDSPRDEASLKFISQETAKAMGINRSTQSYFDYATNGEFIDYAYWKHGTLALTVEVSTIKTPPVDQLPKIITNSINGALRFIELLKRDDEGTLFLRF